MDAVELEQMRGRRRQQLAAAQDTRRRAVEPHDKSETEGGRECEYAGKQQTPIA